MAHPGLDAPAIAAPAWKQYLNTTAAILLGIAFIAAGAMKELYPLLARTLFEQLKVPHVLSLPLVLSLGTLEIASGVFLMIPRLRKLGSMITGFLLVAFLIYFAVFYNELRGADCSCFPLIKENVGPIFFVRDLVMLTLAVLAGLWARPWYGLRTAAIVLACAGLFTSVSFGYTMAHQTGLQAPATITVNGKPYSLQSGRKLLFFFDPECSHCEMAARKLSKVTWKNVEVVAIPFVQPRFAQSFLNDTGMKAVVSSDSELLRKTFKFVSGPYVVGLEDGRQKFLVEQFEEPGQPDAKLRSEGWIQ